MKIEVNNDKSFFHLYNSKISYIINVNDQGKLGHVYYGAKIEAYVGEDNYPDIRREFQPNYGGIVDENRSKSPGVILHEYPYYGRGDYREAAVRIEHKDGSNVSDFSYKDYSIIDGTVDLIDLPKVHDRNGSKTLKVILRDEVKNIDLELYYTIFNDEASVVRFAKVINNSPDEIVLDKVASFSFDLPSGDLDLIQFNGTWARERMIEREKITTGIKRFESKRGTSSHQQSPSLILLDSNASEFQGDAIGISLIYSGSFELLVEKDPYSQFRIQGGINPENFSWVLNPGETFESPQAVLVHSNQGLNALSGEFHKFAREHIVPKAYKSKLRPVLLNNWEATYFDFNEETLKELIDIGSDIGVELFVLDDGWFGRRNDEDSSLGDWFVNEPKLPNGLDPIIEHANSKGMKFGLWFEPEMISKESVLYEEHPEWMLNVPDRAPSPARFQYVLDLSNPDVIDYLYEALSTILSDHNIEYVKWDMNRNLSEVYSSALSPKHQGEVSHRYMLGLYKLMSKLTSEFSEILFESCSGGGGRYDLGILNYMPQTWTSDNTDAMARLKIQYGTSMIFPINSMGSHVSITPNHQTNRITPLETRFHVAMSGVFGLELDLTKMSDEELEFSKKNIEWYKKHRELILNGKFTRILSPFNGNATAWSFINKEQSEALVFYFEVLNAASKPLNKLKIGGLNPDYKYLVKYDSNEIKASGSELANLGIYIYPQLETDFSSRVFEIARID